MDTSQTMNRYQLDETDEIRVEKTGSQPVLHIGDYQFALPVQGGQLEKVKNQFRKAWGEIDNLDPSQFSGASR